MSKVNSIAICTDDFTTKEEFNKTVSHLIKGLVDSEYVVACRWDDKNIGVFIIEYDDKDLEIADHRLKWVENN